MITVKFPTGEKVRAIIFDEPIHRALSGNGVNGVVECAYCDWRAGLFHTGTEQLADEIEEFAKMHNKAGRVHFLGCMTSLS